MQKSYAILYSQFEYLILCSLESQAPTGFEPMDLRDTSVMLYRLNYEASLEAGQVQVQFIHVPVT